MLLGFGGENTEVSVPGESEQTQTAHNTSHENHLEQVAIKGLCRTSFLHLLGSGGGPFKTC